MPTTVSMPRTADALQAAAIARGLPPHAATVEVLDCVDSTNRVLLERPCPPRPHLLLARRQTQGRGRRGRSWLADPDGSLCLSLAWCSRRPLRQCAALGLVAAVACADALRGLGAAVAVKWPNDLVHAGAKLGGVLVEARAAGLHCAGAGGAGMVGAGMGGAEAGGACVVIGIGCNLRLPESMRRDIQCAADARSPAAATASALPATDLQQLLGHALPGRNQLAATLATELLRHLHAFESSGLEQVAHRWPQLDALAGKTVRVLHEAGGERTGLACGLAADGALRVRFPEGEASVRSGEVSVRA